MFYDAGTTHAVYPHLDYFGGGRTLKQTLGWMCTVFIASTVLCLGRYGQFLIWLTDGAVVI